MLAGGCPCHQNSAHVYADLTCAVSAQAQVCKVLAEAGLPALSQNQANKGFVICLNPALLFLLNPAGVQGAGGGWAASSVTEQGQQGPGI
jgi:hypothetical protein